MQPRPSGGTEDAPNFRARAAAGAKAFAAPVKPRPSRRPLPPSAQRLRAEKIRDVVRHLDQVFVTTHRCAASLRGLFFYEYIGALQQRVLILAELAKALLPLRRLVHARGLHRRYLVLRTIRRPVGVVGRDH